MATESQTVRSRNGRLQASLFLPPPVNQVVEDIRRRWDPGMADLVCAHVTLAYEVDELEVFLRRLRRAAVVTAPLEFALTHAACWGSPAGGIYLAVDDTLGAIRSLRQSLLVADPPGLVYTPHVTLVHPRSATPDRAGAAWTVLHELHVDRQVTVHDVALVQDVGRGWETIDLVRLTG